MQSTLDETVTIIGDYTVSKRWLQAINQKARDLASKVAEESWEAEEPQRLKSTVLISKVKDMTSQALIHDGEPENLAHSVVSDRSNDLGASISKAYTSKMDELETNCGEQFKQLWTSRIVDKIRLYVEALNTMETGSLRAQLEELLRSYIVTELVQQTANRAKAKKMLKSSRLKLASRLPKFQSSLGESQDLDSVIEEVEKFSKKIGVEDYDADVLVQKKHVYLSDMTTAMAKDEDAPRLFVSLLIILYSSYHQGVLYATGKYVPKLLKALKPDIDAEQAQWLDQVKDAIKGGKATQDMKDSMRNTAMEKINKHN
jgi:hypothetical protein